jgi:hypothetical protein
MRFAPSVRETAVNSEGNPRWSWTASLLFYAIFAVVVFIVQGSQPQLGPDHITYFQLADSIIDARPDGDYWRESNSVRFFGVLLAYLHTWTGSHVLSTKIVLAVTTVLYLLSAELLFGLFTSARWQTVLFVILSGFAVSFGFSSWGVTDSTALLPRTLVLPIVMLSIWFWLRFYDRPVKYQVFSFLVIGSLIHLSTFYVAGILGLLELWDFVAIRKCRFDIRVPAFLGGLALAAGLIFLFELLGISVGVFHGLIPQLFSVTRFAVPSSPVVEQSVAATAQDAWAMELGLRPWRKHASENGECCQSAFVSALVLMLAFYGVVGARAAGFKPADRFIMAAMLVAIPVFAFVPQTLLYRRCAHSPGSTRQPLKR